MRVASLSPERWRAELRSRRLARRFAGARLLRAFAQAYPEAFFIEIGSNDGEQHDHLRPILLARRWSGIMVEPVPYVFARLRENYGGFDRIALERSAIADRDGRLALHHVAEAGEAERDRLPPWYDGLGSFSKETILGHADKIPDIEQRVVTTEVPCMTFASLCRKHGVSSVDLLLIDTEGYDREIIRQIDFETTHPRLLVYEHYHLSAEQRRETGRYLEDKGYETLQEGFDSWCLDPQAAGELAQTWRDLELGAPAFSADENPA